ncbi:MAG TPA: FCD domain-containing protein [Candidatus Dormibacteraeota bacterium]|nr:FCD domain-containing protein [Candidatus Dormibacteraeota bacterium]
MTDKTEIFDPARFDRLAVPPAWQIVADSLRRKIALGLYRPGDLLPSERQLAEGMGVSRITVREALRVLQGERLIEVRRSNAGGAQVCAPRSRPADEVRGELRRERERFLQIIDCRIANEGLAARLAAVHRTEAHLEALAATIPAMAEASTRLETLAGDAGLEGSAEQAAVEFRRQDSIFHLTIASIPANPYLFRTVEWLRAEFFTPLDLLYRSRNRQDSVGEHAAILAAIRARDPSAAAEAMQRHLGSTRQAMDRLLEVG